MSTNKVRIHKGRTETLPIGLGYDISGDTFASQIRTKPDQSSDLLATWTVAFTTDGTDGELTLTLDDAITGAITVDQGFMDLKRVTGGEPVPVFDNVLEVEFVGTVTA